MERFGAQDAGPLYRTEEQFFGKVGARWRGQH